LGEDEENAKCHDQIGGEVEGNRLGGAEGFGGFGFAGGQREQQESGVGDGGIREQALEIGLRDGGKIAEQQGGAGEDQQDGEHRATGGFIDEKGLEETDGEDESGGFRADG